MVTLSKAETARLAECVDKTLAGSYTMNTVKQFEAASGAGFVESNPSIADGKTIAFRATADGIAFIQNMRQREADAAAFASGTPAPQPSETTPATVAAPTVWSNKTMFNIVTVDNIEEFAKASGKRNRETKYPFDALAVGQGFDVPPTADRPEPWKSLQSTITTASRRYATVTGTKVNAKGKTVNEYAFSRKFAVRKVTLADGSAVARVARIA